MRKPKHPVSLVFFLLFALAVLYDSTASPYMLDRQPGFTFPLILVAIFLGFGAFVYRFTKFFTTFRRRG